MGTAVPEALLREYYVDDTPQFTIYNKYNLTGPRSKIYQRFGTYTHQMWCIHCRAVFISSFVSKHLSRKLAVPASSLVPRSENPKNLIYLSPENYYLTVPQCSQCRHVIHLHCKCQHCADAKEEKRSRIVNKLKLQYEQDIPDCVPLSSLTPKQLLYLLYWLRAESIPIDSKALTTRSNLDSTKSVLFSYSHAVSQLISSNILVVDTASIDACVHMGSADNHDFNHQHLRHRLHLDVNNNVYDKLCEAAEKAATQPEMRDALERIWLALGEYEAVVIFLRLCQSYGLTYRHSDDFATTLRQGVAHLGLGVVAYCIKTAIKQNAAELARAREEKNTVFTPLYAANTAKRYLSEYLLNPSVEKKYPPVCLRRSAEDFPEPLIAALFSRHFLPIAVDYLGPPKLPPIGLDGL